MDIEANKKLREAELKEWRRWEMRHLPIRIIGYIIKYTFYLGIVLCILYGIAIFFGK